MTEKIYCPLFEGCRFYKNWEHDTVVSEREKQHDGIPGNIINVSAETNDCYCAAQKVSETNKSECALIKILNDLQKIKEK